MDDREAFVVAGASHSLGFAWVTVMGDDQPRRSCCSQSGQGDGPLRLRAQHVARLSLFRPGPSTDTSKKGLGRLPKVLRGARRSWRENPALPLTRGLRKEDTGKLLSWQGKDISGQAGMQLI